MIILNYRIRPFYLAFILVLLLLILNTWAYEEKAWPYKEKESIFLEDVKEVINKIENNASEVDYKDYLEVSFNKSRILYNHTADVPTQDDEFCSLVYSKVHIKNISGKPIAVNVKIFLPYELASKFVFTDATLGPREDKYERLKNFYLKENERINISFNVIAKHYNNALSIEEKEIFDKYRDTLYFQFLIDGKKSYAKIDASEEPLNYRPCG